MSLDIGWFFNLLRIVTNSTFNDADVENEFKSALFRFSYFTCSDLSDVDETDPTVNGFSIVNCL